jgi:hypothetical protein
MAGLRRFIWSNLWTRNIWDKLTSRGHQDWPDKATNRQSGFVNTVPLGRTYCQWRTCQPGHGQRVPQLHHPRGVGCINVVSGKPNTIPGVLEHALLVMRFRTRTAVTHRKEEIKLARKRKPTRALSVRPVPERFSTSSDAQRKIRIACSGLGDLLI